MSYCRLMPRAPHPTPIKSGRNAPGRPQARVAGPGAFDAALVAQVLQAALDRHARVIGVTGAQGAGKSTLARQLVHAATARGLRAATVSLDDLYLGRRARARLARGVHPLFATRGPPGTHDLARGEAVLAAHRAGRPVRLPRYDKWHDRPVPPSRWPAPRTLDLLVFEGWCIGVPPQPDTALARPVNALEREDDAGGGWRRAVNAQLAGPYRALWSHIDLLVALHAPGFDVVPAWRAGQEASVRARRGGAGMSAAEIARFVAHFERLTRHALRVMPRHADLLVTLDTARGARMRPSR